MIVDAKTRTMQVLRFLRDFDQVRNKPLRHIRQHISSLFCRECPVGSGCQLHLADFDVEDGDGTPGGTLLDAPLLTVHKQRLTQAPSPPAVLADWLDVDGRDPERPPVPKASRPRSSPDGRPAEPERFGDDPDRVKAFDRWVNGEWRRWAESEGPRRKVQALYERLYDLHLTLRRDTEDVELVWATGMLAWHVDGEEILHPLVLSRVDLLFDRDEGVLQVVPATSAPEFADHLFQGMTQRSFSQFDELAKEFRDRPIAPWDRPEVATLFTRVANVLTRGTVVDGPVRPGPDPVIGREDLLLLRKRRVGYGRDIERWLQLLEDGLEPPAPVRHIVGEATGTAAGGDREGGASEDLLFPLPANPEQEEIARRLARHAGVVVQGPPGTGKSHTIANLVSHLLAHGKTILITAQTERALRVLRDKVPESIRSLCVSVTGNDVGAQEELKTSVQIIIERTGGSRERERREAERVRAELARVRSELAQLWAQAAGATRAEAAEVTIAGQSWTPTRAGQHLREHESADGWLPDGVPFDRALRLSDAELDELMALLTRVSREDLADATRDLPDPQTLPPTPAFQARMEQAARLRAVVTAAGPIVGDWRIPSAGSHEALLGLLDALRQGYERAVEDLAAFRTPWLQQIRTDITRHPARRGEWQRLAGELSRRRAEVLDRRAAIAHRTIAVTLSGSLQQQIGQVQALRAHVEGGGGFGLSFNLLRGGLKQTRAACEVDRAAPSTVEEIDAILAWLRIRQLRRELVNLVANEIEPLGGPSLRDRQEQAEHAVNDVLDPLTRLLGWHEQTWERLRRELCAIGCELQPRGRPTAPAAGEPPSIVIEEDPDEITTAARLVDLLTGLSARVGLAIHDEWAGALHRQLEAGTERPRASGLWSRLLDAARAEDGRAWDELLCEVARLLEVQPEAQRLAGLLERLASVAPRWAAGLVDAAAERRPLPSVASVKSAWQWSQLEHWLRQHLARPSPEDLRRQIDARKSFEAELIARLVEHCTWAALDVPHAERQALAGWQQIIARIGKGTGKRVPLLKRQAQELMSQARRAVPVWIMPLGKVIENFGPDGPRFDVVIVDESSQADTFGLLALMRGERAVVVGDDNQISPAAVGQRLDIVDQLIAKHLGGTPNSGLYDGQQSLYDLATAAFGGVIRLREHFRCVPEIIGFSNVLSYQGEIRPLRDPTSTALVPPVLLHRVTGYRAPGSHVNEKEARWIAALIATLCGHPLYKEATIGAISLLGGDQARLILEYVRALVPPEELDRRAFIAGDAYHFQGDEREVMFLSLVEAPGERRPAVLNRRPDQQRFNVAASRARDQMWIAYSVDASHFHPEDMRARLLTHYAHRDEQARNWRDVSEVLRDDRYYFQRLVAQQIIQRGYRVRAEACTGSTWSWTGRATASRSNATASAGTRSTRTATTWPGR
jgi:hypothetical protein